MTGQPFSTENDLIHYEADLEAALDSQRASEALIEILMREEISRGHIAESLGMRVDELMDIACGRILDKPTWAFVFKVADICNVKVKLAFPSGRAPKAVII
jgi:hypothetical protein